MDEERKLRGTSDDAPVLSDLSEPDAMCTVSTRGAQPLFCDLVYKYVGK